MRFGLGRLRLSPDAFWAMTAPELAAAAAARQPPSPAPLDRTALAALARRFPDSL